MSSLYITSDKPRAGKTSLAVTIQNKIKNEGKTVSLLNPFSQQNENITLEAVVESFNSTAQDTDINIVEGLSNLEDSNADLARELVEAIDAKVILVLGYSPSLYSGIALRAQMLFGDRLAGVVINGVTKYTTHQKSSPNREYGKQESILTGSCSKMNEKAFNFLKAY